MNTRQKLLLLLILVFPGLFYFFLELSNANFKKMPYYGPKVLNVETKDTLYYSVDTKNLLDSNLNALILDTVNYPVFVIGFLHENLRNEGYKLNGLLDFTLHEPYKLNYIDIFLVNQLDSLSPKRTIKSELKIKNKDIRQAYCHARDFTSVNEKFFRKKPVHVFPYFFVLVDKKRNLRGYYDPTFVSEMKRMIQEFEHLKLRDEKAKLIQKNKIEKKP